MLLPTLSKHIKDDGLWGERWQSMLLNQEQVMLRDRDAVSTPHTEQCGLSVSKREAEGLA